MDAAAGAAIAFREELVQLKLRLTSGRMAVLRTARAVSLNWSDSGPDYDVVSRESFSDYS
jgi:hypothetical protein